MPELVGEAAAAGAAKLLPQCVIAGKLCESPRERRNVLWRDEESGLAGDTDFPRTVHVVADDRLTGDERLRKSAGQAFAMIGPRDNAGTLEPFARAFEEGQLALHMGTPRVVEGWLDIYAAGLAQRAGGQPADEAALAFGWGTNEYMRSRGGYGVTLECGQHQDPAAPEVAHRAIHAALRLLGMVEPDPRAEPPAAPALLRLVSVKDRDSEEDQFVREWATFDPVAKGEPIGVRADGSVLTAERDGFIVFPNAEALPGTEWFYFAVESDRDLTRPAPALSRAWSRSAA